MFIPRPHLEKGIKEALEHNPGVVLLGPRQCGKTTIARRIAEEITPSEFFDLENPLDLARLDNPMLALQDLTGLIVLDEVQRKPDLFEVLRVLMDRPKRRNSFLILGSASPGVVRGVSETLAGRVALIPMSGFNLMEVGPQNYKRLWIRGGLPRSYLAPNDEVSSAWRLDFIQTFLERDIPQLGIHIPSSALRRFWMMLAHYHGQVWNASTFAESIGSSQKTARRYLDLLTDVFVVRQLQPWYQNIKKRQVKAPKVYVRDSGLLHSLLGLAGLRELQSHPKLGASWEGFIVEQVASMARLHDIYFWATHGGTEVDLLIMRGGQRMGIEAKYTDAPKMTRSIRIAIGDLELDRVFIIYPGPKSFPLEDKVQALSVLDIGRIFEELKQNGHLERGKRGR